MNYQGAGILEKILSTVSKGLAVAGQLIPLYQESEPIIKGAQSLLNSLKEKNKESPKEETLDIIDKVEVPLKTETPTLLQKEKVKNNPQFFI